MSTQFLDIAGILTDGSGPFGSAELKRLVARGCGEANAAIRSEEELAIAAWGGSNQDDNSVLADDFLTAGNISAASEQWRTTQSVSSFGEGGTGAWAALRVLPDQHRVWLSRDQFGQQPLYYTEKSGAIAFSTSMAWLFDSGFVARRFDVERFGELVQLQFLAGTSGPFADIRRVNPGETLVIERGRIIDRLRRPQVPHSDRRTTHHEAALDALDSYLKEALRDALGETLRSSQDQQNEFGCVISGDLTSTVLAVALARATKRKATAFVPVILDGEVSRATLEMRMEFASTLGLDAVAVPVRQDGLWQRLPAIAETMMDPVADHVGLLWDGVAQAAKARGTKLVLPSGGQELFGAYGRYRMAMRPVWMGGKAMRSRGHLQGLGGLPDGPSHWRDEMRAAEGRIRGGNFSRVQMLQLLDLATWLPNDTMLGEHQLFHEAGIESVRPFLEPVMSGFAFALPDGMKLRGQSGGILLRNWLARTYPTAHKMLEAERPNLAVFDWIAKKSDEIGPAVDRVLTEAQLMANGQAKDVFTLLAKQPGKRAGMAAWQLLYFACWYRIHVGGASADGDVASLLSVSSNLES